MPEKSVAEKAKARAEEMKAVAKKEELSIAPQSGGAIGGIYGMTSEDVNLPFVYIVQDNSKHAELSDGSKAKTGLLFHSTRKVAYKDLEVIIVHAVKTKETKDAIYSDESEQKEETVWRVLMVTPTNLNSPFMMKFRGMGFWYGWKSFLSMLVDQRIGNASDKVVSITTKEQSTQNNRVNFIPVFDLVRDTKGEERVLVKELSSRFSVNAVETVEDINVDEVDFGDLDLPK